MTTMATGLNTSSPVARDPAETLLATAEDTGSMNASTSHTPVSDADIEAARSSFAQECAGCNQVCSVRHYSDRELAMYKANARCTKCVEVEPYIDFTEWKTPAPSCTVDMHATWYHANQGTLKKVFSGISSKGSKVVVKMVDSASIHLRDLADTHYFAHALRMTKVEELIAQWNAQLYRPVTITLNPLHLVAPVQRLLHGNNPEMLGDLYYTIEARVDNITTFNSNTGWENVNEYYAPALSAFSHYTWFITNGQILICDLQGCTQEQQKREKPVVRISDPAILSNGKVGLYGPTDLGIKGIHTFFQHHTCSDHCRALMGDDKWKLRPLDVMSKAAREEYLSRKHKKLPCLRTTGVDQSHPVRVLKVLKGLANDYIVSAAKQDQK
eukprot:GFYU01001934.1.p1 GENE.GFYU01001934.1~~GFYU01001934.1.p1  ORF type:complete len:384 (+),score=69.76 GFYU01001934.1:107-1258(+)